MKKVMDKKVTKVEEKANKVLSEDLSKSDKMRKLFDMGVSLKQIAALVGVRYNFVYNVISRYVLESGCTVIKETTNTKKSKISEMLTSGVAVKEIVKELGVNINYVYKIKKELGLTNKKETKVAK